jgi:VIT1/CCC1 family predicted Fe2+/Mn2+ transporter
LASSNINIKNGVDDVVTQAWISKLEQVYQRARLIMGNSQDFAIIQNIYEQKRSELKSRKFKGLAIAAFIVGGYMLLMSFIFFMAETPAAAVILLLVGIALLVGGIKSISIYTKKNKHNL